MPSALDTARPRQPHAALLAIGTANPAKCGGAGGVLDWYFRVNQRDHLADLKAKMKRMCDESAIKKRHFYHTEEMIAGHPEFIDRALPALDARLGIANDTVPELAMAAAARAIAEWGRPAADITHLVVATNAGAHAPGADARVESLLGLRATVERTVLYMHGCSPSCGALRLAKDIAENNRGTRVLVACAEVTLPGRAFDMLVFMALFGAGAGAVVVGADPRTRVEHPIFHMVSTSQAIIPGTDERVSLLLGERGLDCKISGAVPALVRAGVERCLLDALTPLGLGASAG
uniref:Chalcone/stilbene synthase N-terminal domain-containing protein n=1 Tax=Oryza punctata TaxID=4537 RepID=A0A0E0MFY7_ORYPU